MSEQMQNFRLHQLQHDVAAAALSGVACTEIDEGVIGQSQASEDEKAALRLFACSFYSRFELRRMALDRLRELSGGGSSEAARQLPLTARLRRQDRRRSDECRERVRVTRRCERSRR